MPEDTFDEVSTLFKVIPRCHWATSHYMSQLSPRFMASYGITIPKWECLNFILSLFHSSSSDHRAGTILMGRINCIDKQAELGNKISFEGDYVWCMLSVSSQVSKKFSALLWSYTIKCWCSMFARPELVTTVSADVLAHNGTSCMQEIAKTVQYIYSAVPLQRSKFSPKSSQKIAHSWPVRVRYGVSFVNITSEAYFASVIVIQYAKSCYVRQCYNVTWLYVSIYWTASKSV